MGLPPDAVKKGMEMLDEYIDRKLNQRFQAFKNEIAGEVQNAVRGVLNQAIGQVEGSSPPPNPAGGAAVNPAALNLIAPLLEKVFKGGGGDDVIRVSDLNKLGALINLVNAAMPSSPWDKFGPMIVARSLVKGGLLTPDESREFMKGFKQKEVKE
jgi:hypothetical protein